jgi:hypothetical protein
MSWPISPNFPFNISRLRAALNFLGSFCSTKARVAQSSKNEKLEEKKNVPIDQLRHFASQRHGSSARVGSDRSTDNLVGKRPNRSCSRTAGYQASCHPQAHLMYRDAASLPVMELIDLQLAYRNRNDCDHS